LPDGSPRLGHRSIGIQTFAGNDAQCVQTAGMTLLIEETPPTLSTEQTLMGWRREFCVELMGEGKARIFLRATEKPSLKATELRQGILFHRVGTTFADLAGCVATAREPLEQLASTAVRQQPSVDNLFTPVTYQPSAWEAAVTAIENWQRRAPATTRPGSPGQQRLA
jgi:hypothetical protein